MARAVCYKCGLDKTDAFSRCGFCRTQPSVEADFALSLVLSEHLSSEQELARFADTIGDGRYLSVEPLLIGRAKAALSDKQLMSMLRRSMDPLAAQPHRSSARQQDRPSRRVDGSGMVQNPNESIGGRETSIHRNAFWILGATLRDDRHRIVELAEEKALQSNDDACRKARAELTNPKARLSAEMAWLPGVSPKKAREVVETLLTDPGLVRNWASFPTLALANVMINAFETLEGDENPDAVANLILDFARIAEQLDADEILRDLNEDRAVSRFPEIKSVEAELAERLKFYKGSVRDALNKMPPDKLVEAMTKAVCVGTKDGERHAPALLDDLIDAYEAETQGFLAKEAENVAALASKARELAHAGEPAVGKAIDHLEKVVRNWHRVAHPIQVSMKARGIAHQPSHSLAFDIRSLGIELYNKHDMAGVASRITHLLAELFHQLPEVVETLEKDSEFLTNIASRENNAKTEQLEFERELAFEAQIGVVFKDTLRISSAGVQWKDAVYPLNSITRVRWGAVRRSINGIPTGTEYTIAFGGNRTESVVETKQEKIYTAFTEKLWKAVCVRLMTDLLKQMREGKKFAFGDAVVDDMGVQLWERHLFSADIEVYCRWNEVTILSQDGSFVIKKKGAKGVDASASYMQDANTHLLEHLVRLNFKGSDPRLSDLLKSG